MTAPGRGALSVPYDAMALAIEAAAALGFSSHPVDDENRIVRFEKEATSFLYVAGTFPINHATGVRIARDKADTEAVLARAGFRVPGGEHVFVVPEWADERAPGREIGDAFGFAERIGYPVFVKPLNSSLGRLAQVIETPDQLGHHLVRIGRLSWGAVIQPVLRGLEQRVFILDGRVRFTYAKRPAEGAANANPNAGGVVSDFTVPEVPALNAWAGDAARAMGLRVCALDVFADGLVAVDPRAATIIEVNANPILKTIWDLGEQETVRAIWHDVMAAHVCDLERAAGVP
jgi:glutathione synthase/RimK-type ligase-like ATP-grasp enzyme